MRSPWLVSEIEQDPTATEPKQVSTPSVTVTVPVGVPAPGASTVTSKLTVTASPVFDGSGSSEVMAVVVSAGSTVNVSLAVPLKPSDEVTVKLHRMDGRCR